jgi:hypothetical protein
MEGERGRIYENLYLRSRGSYHRHSGNPPHPGYHTNSTLDILLSEVPYFMGSTTTAVPYAKTSVTPCMTSVAS